MCSSVARQKGELDPLRTTLGWATAAEAGPSGRHDARFSIMETSSFQRMTSANLPMVQRWLETPAVREWWVEADGQPSDPFEEDALHDPT
jgi:hypothetical protein